MLCLLMFPMVVTAQSGWVVGTVKDQASGEPLIGASVLVSQEGEWMGEGMTDFEGRYHLALPAGAYELEFSHIGYAPQRMDGVTVEAGKESRLEVEVESSVVVLDPVVVKAYKTPLVIFTHSLFTPASGR